MIADEFNFVNQLFIFIFIYIYIYLYLYSSPIRYAFFASWTYSEPCQTSKMELFAKLLEAGYMRKNVSANRIKNTSG